MTAYGAKPTDKRVRAKRDPRWSYRWRKLRLVILARDLWTCHWCGRPANEVDHVMPLSQGGDMWDTTNLVAACGPCNRARPVHNDVGVHNGASRFSMGSGVKHAPAPSLSPQTVTSRTLEATSLRISHETALQHANRVQALSGDYTGRRAAYSYGGCIRVHRAR